MNANSRNRLLLHTALVAAAALYCAPAETASAPRDLRATGLYSDFATRTIDPRNRAYSPQYPLWSDGAKKRRWIFLPPGRAIDATDPDHWEFPVGTKFWKEFAWDRAVETRYLEKVGKDEWTYATYVWSPDGRSATLAPPEGVRGAYPLAPGVSHDVPGVQDCKACHEGSSTQILGFDALQLSPDRDPNAPHGAPLAPNELTLSFLVAHHLLEKFPASLEVNPPKIAGRTPTERAALGYLHGNCAGCHNPADPYLGSLGLFLKHSALVHSPEDEPALQSAVGQKSRFQIPGLPPGQTERVKPGTPAESAIAFRMGSRNPFQQMPPLGTKLVDEEGLAVLKRWIQESREADPSSQK